MGDPIDQSVLEMDYIARNRCFGGESTTQRVQKWAMTTARVPSAAAQSWVPVNTVAAERQMIAFFEPTNQHSVVFHPQASLVDPVRLAVEVLTGADEVRRREYWERQIRVAVEEALSVRDEPARRIESRGSEMVQSLLERLREKARGAVLPPADEAWKMVDFSALDDPE